MNNSHPVWVTVHDLERPQDFQLVGSEETIDNIRSGANATAGLRNVPGYGSGTGTGASGTAKVGFFNIVS
ncbi:MAG: hypothetical protein R2741_03930 [Methanolobus sp.]